MKNNITNLEIKNFKSIKDVKLDCKRINVFIGEPNVGKSNVLEALSLFDAPLSAIDKPILKEYIRYEKSNNLFYDNDRKNVIEVNTNIGDVRLKANEVSNNYYDIFIGQYDIITKLMKEKGHTNMNMGDFLSAVVYKDNPLINSVPIKPFYHSFTDDEQAISIARIPYYGTLGNIPIKRYIFKSLSKHDNHFMGYLSQPFGDNLYSILESNPEFYEEVTSFFTKDKLDLLLDTAASEMRVQKRVGNRVIQFPYWLAADTIQRIIFHLAAIDTNTDSVLLFEEPEAHSFPPYISMLSEKIIESKNNQFFIATHSPFLLTPFIEQCSYDELAIFICTYENYETKIKTLSKEEILNIMDTGISDLFYNIPAFQK